MRRRGSKTVRTDLLGKGCPVQGECTFRTHKIGTKVTYQLDAVQVERTSTKQSHSLELSCTWSGWRGRRNNLLDHVSDQAPTSFAYRDPRLRKYLTTEHSAPTVWRGNVLWQTLAIRQHSPDSPCQLHYPHRQQNQDQTIIRKAVSADPSQDSKWERRCPNFRVAKKLGLGESWTVITCRSHGSHKVKDWLLPDSLENYSQSSDRWRCDWLGCLGSYFRRIRLVDRIPNYLQGHQATHLVVRRGPTAFKRTSTGEGYKVGSQCCSQCS